MCLKTEHQGLSGAIATDFDAVSTIKDCSFSANASEQLSHLSISLLAQRLHGGKLQIKFLSFMNGRHRRGRLEKELKKRDKESVIEFLGL